MAQDFPSTPPVQPGPQIGQPAPRRNNTLIIVLLVLVVVCVCCALILWAGWTFGDTIVNWLTNATY